MLLGESERAALPVGHLFTFAEFALEDFFCHFSKACLAACYTNATKIILCVNKIIDELVEAHAGQMLLKHFQIVLEGKADDYGSLVGKNFSQGLV